MNLNKVFLIGRLTTDPQLRSTTTGQQVASLSVATNRTWTDKNNQKQETAEFHNVVVWGRQAEIVNQFLRRGSMILIEGRLQTRDWEDKQGQKRKTTEIVAERIQFGPKSAGVSKPSGRDSAPSSPTSDVPTINVDEEIKTEDLPF
ncbi:MAG: single-stranded DNA-binding protein [bacterium]|nr:single-stranded DNA-binding protein [bacterium]